jgi:hypothetical protein
VVDVVGIFDGWLDTPARAGFSDCLEQALTASKTPRIAKPAIMASFCWRDQDEIVVPVNVLLAFCVDFQIVDILSPPCGGRSCASEKQEWDQLAGH